MDLIARQEMIAFLTEGIPFPTTLGQDEARMRLFDYLIDKHHEEFGVFNDHDCIRVEKYQTVALEIDCLDDRFLIRRTNMFDDEMISDYIKVIFTSILELTAIVEREAMVNTIEEFVAKKTYNERVLLGDKFIRETSADDDDDDDLDFEWL